MFKQFIKKTQISEEEFVGAKIPQDQYDYKQLLLSSVQLSDFSPTSFFESIRRMADDKTMAELLERAIEKPEDVSTEFFKSIIDFVEKRPVEGVFLVDPNIESIELGMGQRKLYVCIGYVDNFGNYYHEIKEIPMVLKEKATINFRQDWEEQAGDWNWLLKKK
jgi:hypothetical protein